MKKKARRWFKPRVGLIIDYCLTSLDFLGGWIIYWWFSKSYSSTYFLWSTSEQPFESFHNKFHIRQCSAHVTCVSIPEDREILHLYIPWSVSLHSMAHKGSLLSLLLLLWTYTHTFFYASTNKHKVCPPYIDTWIFPFSLCLCGNQNNNSEYITARNANPHWSERSMSCGSTASHGHQSQNKEAGIHAGCCAPL